MIRTSMRRPQDAHAVPTSTVAQRPDWRTRPGAPRKQAGTDHAKDRLHPVALVGIRRGETQLAGATAPGLAHAPHC